MPVSATQRATSSARSASTSVGRALAAARRAPRPASRSSAARTRSRRRARGAPSPASANSATPTTRRDRPGRGIRCAAPRTSSPSMRGRARQRPTAVAPSAAASASSSRRDARFVPREFSRSGANRSRGNGMRGCARRGSARATVDGIRDDLVDAGLGLHEPVHERRVRAVLEQAPHEIRQQVLVAADGRVDAAAVREARPLEELAVELLAHAVQALQLERPAGADLEQPRDRVRVVRRELRIQRGVLASAAPCAHARYETSVLHLRVNTG